MRWRDSKLAPAVDLGFMRHAVRSLARAPAFSAAAIVTIALGVGLNSAMFSVVYSVLLDPLPYRDPERLVQITQTHPEFRSLQVAAPDFFDWQKTASSFQDIAAYTFQEMNRTTLLGRGDPEWVQATQASHQLFPMLGIQPLIGRAFTADEEAKQSHVGLLSESIWRRKFSADRSVIGSTVRLEGFSFTVVGVVPTSQAFPVWADIWMPLSLLEPQLKEIRRFHPLEVVARLKPGVGVAQAQAEMQAVASSLARTYPDTNSTIGAVVIPLASSITGEIRPSLLIIWAAVSLILLLGCANVAHLVMVRSVHRGREVAVRAALGATSGQLLRFLLAENMVLALAGGVLGAGLAYLSLPVIRRLAAGEIPRPDSIAFTPGTLLFTGAAALLCVILFGLPLLMQARSVDLYRTMQQSAGISLTHRRSLFGSIIIAAEIALAFVVITGAGLLYRSFAALLNESAGFDARGVLAVNVGLAAGNWEQSASLFENQLAPRIRHIPGVTSVAAANCAPMTLGATERSRYATRFGVPGRVFEPGKFPVAQARWITPDYFRTLRIALKRGRFFTESDAGKERFIINEALARRFFPDQDPVGKQLLMNVVSPKPELVSIIGVVADVRDLGLDVEPRPTIYSYSVPPSVTVLVGAAVDPLSIVRPVRDAIRAVGPEAPITKAAPLTSIVQQSLAGRRFALYLLASFAALAGLLSAVGIYGVISYSVSRRTREFAIRFAVGAQARDLRYLILRNFATSIAVGVFAGGCLAYVFARAMRSQLYQLSPADPVVLVATVLVIGLIVLASALAPLSRAASVSPTTALRES